MSRILHTATTRLCEGWRIIHSNFRRVATWASSPTSNDISTLRYNYYTCTCRMIWMHSPQSPKISTTQHERSFSFFSKISSQVRGSELHWVSSRIGEQQTAFAFVMMCPGGGIGLEYAMTVNSAWARSPSAPKEQSNHYHLLHIKCVVWTMLPSRHSFLVVQVTKGMAIPPHASWVSWAKVSISPSFSWPRIRRVWSCSFSCLTQLTTWDSSAVERACKYQTHIK